MMLPMEKKNSHYRYQSTWLQLVRPMTLTGTIAPTLAGTALAAQFAGIKWSIFIIFLLASLLVQMAVNILNDYFDFKKGQDAEKWALDGRGPMIDTLPVAAGLMLIAAVALGVWLAFQSHESIFLFGAIGTIGGTFYSAGKKPLSSIGLGELVAAIFLGFMVFTLAFVIQRMQLDLVVFAFALPYAALIATMILTNNIRDLQKDKGFRTTLPMILGRKKAISLLTFLISFPYIWTILMVILKIYNIEMLLGLLALPVAVRLRWAFRKDCQREDELAAMKWSAIHHWVFGLLIALGIGLGSFSLL